MRGAECLRCDARVGEHPSCPACTWPYTPEGWQHTRFKIARLTFDTSCVNEHRRDEALNTLEAWAAEGRVRIERSPTLLEELRGPSRIQKAERIDPQPQIFRLGESVLDGPDVLAGPLLDPLEWAGILFPTTAANRLTVQQQNDVAHLQHHVRTGGDCFVTRNPRDFIDGGKQATLAARGISGPLRRVRW